MLRLDFCRIMSYIVNMKDAYTINTDEDILALLLFPHSLIRRRQRSGKTSLKIYLIPPIPRLADAILAGAAVEGEAKLRGELTKQFFAVVEGFGDVYYGEV